MCTQGLRNRRTDWNHPAAESKLGLGRFYIALRGRKSKTYKSKQPVQQGHHLVRTSGWAMPKGRFCKVLHRPEWAEKKSRAGPSSGV